MSGSIPLICLSIGTSGVLNHRLAGLSGSVKIGFPKRTCGLRHPKERERHVHANQRALQLGVS